MLLQRAIDRAQADKTKPHTFKFVTKGSNKRKGGYTVTMENTVITSTNHGTRSMKLKCLDSGQIRMCYFALLIEFDGHEILV